MDKNSTPTIRDLYPNLGDKERAQAQDNLDQYLALVLRIFDRTELNPQPAPLAPDMGTLRCTASGSETSS